MFKKEINYRVRFVLLIILFVFVLVILKVFYIEVINYKKLNTYASNLWSRNLPIKADRGIIYDRNGVELANNFYEQAIDLGVEIEIEEVLDIIPGKVNKVITDDKNVQDARLYLTYMCNIILKSAASLVGIQMPDRM